MKRIDKLIGDSARRTMQQDRQMRKIVSQTMPPEWSDALLFARVDSGDLHLTVESASWVTKMRFLQSRIRQALEREGVPCQRIRWHVGTAAPAEERYSQRHPPVISAAAARQVRSAADCLEEGSLKESLLAIAARAESPD